MGSSAACWELYRGIMRSRSLLVFALLVAGFWGPPVPKTGAAAALELYGTFHAMGIIATIGAGDDPDQDATASIEYRVGGSGQPYQQGYPPSRVSSTSFVSSLFWLEPGTVYDVRVTFRDADGTLNGVSLNGQGATRSEIAIPTPNKSFYVSPRGNGTACTLAAPCALLEGLNQAGPGDAVVLRGGVYYEGEIYPARSGTAGAPIVLKSYSGEMAVLDGADPATFIWNAASNGVYHTSINVSDPHLVVANGRRLYPYRSLADLEALRWDISGFYAEGKDLYVHLEGDADPNRMVMAIARYNYAFQIQQDFIYFLDLVFRHYGQGGGARAIKFNQANDNVVQGCTFALNDMGVVIGYESQRTVIQDSEFYDTVFEWPWEAVKDGSSLEAGGIRFNYPTTPRGTVIRRNLFHGTFDGFNACPTTTAGSTNETDVYDNFAYDILDDGMQADGQCSNVRIWGNVFRDGLSGISLAPAKTGPVYAIRNLIYRTGITPFKFNSSGDESGHMYLFHNTCDAVVPNADGLWIGSPGSWKLIYSRNNIWAGTGFALKNKNTGQPADLDFDDLWNGDGGALVRWGSMTFATLADFVSATGQERQGLSVMPGFSEPENGDYTLASTSTLIDAGVVIPGINNDYAGSGPDLGAFEYDLTGFILAVTPPNDAIDPGGSAKYTIEVQPVGGFMTTVVLMASSPSTNLSLKLVPAAVPLPGQATLTITDSHTGTLLPGLWYTVPITATAGDIIRTLSVGLIVGGARTHLPILFR